VSSEPGYSLRIRELPPDERPRERLAKYGASSLQTSELLAILLRTGSQKQNAHDLGRRLITHFGDLGGVAGAALEELQSLEGIGPTKAVEIKAAFELGKRMATFAREDRPVISSPEDAAGLLMSELGGLSKEHFVAVLLNTKNHVLRVETISVGTLDSSLIHPRECFRPAVTAGCASVIFAHNHPSGDPTPSAQDKEITHRLQEAGELLGIPVLDHLIIAGQKFISMKTEGML